MKRFLFLILLFSISIEYISSEKILFLLAIASKSHKNVFDPLIEALASNGHQVSVISPAKSSKVHPNVQEIVPAGTDFLQDIMPDPFGMRRSGKLSGLFFDMDKVLEICHTVYKNPEFQAMTNQSFDLVIQNAFLNNCFDGIIWKVKAPHIILSTMAAPPFITQLTGNYLPLSFVPNPFLDLGDKMTFGERVINLCVDFVAKLLGIFYYIPATEGVYRKHLGSHAPGYYEIHKNVSLLMMNSYFSLTYPRPNLPDNVEIGGMHCRPAKPLPKDLEEFLSGEEHGFVYFSLGSIVQAKNMPEETRKKFLKAFSKLKQRVIWKWESNMTDLPPNVKISNWLPQQDILGHRNIRAFITHGGLLSTQEAIYHGVPLLGLPIFADQDLNMKQAASQGYALTVEILDLDISDLESKLNRILIEPQFYERAKYLSSIFRDQPQTPVERATYWVEYILRHKGARHLRSAARDLNYFQVKSLDVLSFLLLIIGSVVYIVFCMLRFVFRKCCGRKQNREKASRKKKLN